MFQLFRQSSLFIVQNNSRRRLQQHTIIIGNLFESPDEDAAGRILDGEKPVGADETGCNDNHALDIDTAADRLRPRQGNRLEGRRTRG